MSLADLQQRCPVMDIPVPSCAHCRRLPDPPVVQRTVGRPFAAAYAGRCVDCEERYEPGDRIRRVSTGGYLHADCGDEDE